MSDRINEIKQRLNAATKPPFVELRYEHGGGRAYKQEENGGRQLVFDVYEQADREFYFNAYGDVEYFLAEIERYEKIIA